MFSRGGLSNLWRFSATGFSTTLPHTGSRRPNRAELELCWSISLSWAQTATQGQTGPSLRFLSKNEVTPPPKKGGWLSSFLGSSSLPYSFTTGSHGSNRACLGYRWCRFPTQLSKPHTGPYGAEFGFTVFSWGVSAPARLPSPFPACNSPPLG